MINESSPPSPALLDEIGAAIERATAHTYTTTARHDAARLWLESDFDDVEEIAAWLAARCYEAASARILDDAGLTPEQASFRTTSGDADYEDTIAFKFTNGDLSLTEARRIVTNEFWNEY